MGRSTVTPEKKIEIKTLLKMGLIQRQVVPGVKTAEWTLSNDKRLCGSTGRRRLISMGHKSYTLSDEWNNVIWSDEAHFEVLNHRNRTRNEPSNFVPRVQCSGGNVSVRRCMPRGARSLLMIYTEKMNGPAYIKTIQSALPMFIENTFDTGNDNWIYMQVNTPHHTSKDSMKWFKDNNSSVLK
ncbi:unnamed protein product [Rotaria magnacalcarata]